MAAPASRSDKSLPLLARLASNQWHVWPQPGSRLDRLETFFSNQGAKVLITTMYCIASVLAFQYGAHIAIDQHYTDLRKYITPIGRGCGVCMDLQCALLIVPMLRALATKLRQTSAAVVFPFDSTIEMHKIIAYVICLCTFIHGTGQGINYVLYYELTPGVFGKKSVLITGIALTAILVAIVVTSQDCIRRRRWFEMFYYVHHLFPLFYAGLVLHGCRHGRPTTWMWIIGPCLMYMFDRLYRVCSSFTVTKTIVSASLPAPDVVHIAIDKPFKYQAGQYCEICIPAVSSSEFHPFTIASSPSDTFMEFYVKGLGNWTNELCNLAKSQQPAVPADAQRERSATAARVQFQHIGAVCGLEGLEIKVRGPFGAPAEHFQQFDDLVLIGSGIGATPFASVCKDVAAAHRSRHVAINRNPSMLPSPSALMPNKRLPSTADALRNESTASNTRRFSLERGERLSSTRPWQQTDLDWAHDDWPFAGNCGCSPIRIVMERSRAQQLTTVAGEDGLESGPTSGASFATGRTVSTAAKTLAVPVWLIQLQRMLHTVTLQFSLLALWLVTVTISLVVVISDGGYYLTCLLIDELHTTQRTPNWATESLFIGEIIFMVVAFCMVLGVVVDLACVGFTRFWRVPCLRMQSMLVLPGCITLVTVNSLMSYDIWRPALSLHYALIFFTKVLLVCPLLIRFVHLTGAAAKLTGHNSRDASRVRSVRFYWMNRHASAQQWLLPDLAKLERADAEALFSFHVHLTRDREYDGQDSGLRHGVHHGRPKWNEIFRKLHDHYPPGSRVGVFFCGTSSMARVLQQVCTSCSTSSVSFLFKKENF